MVNTRIKKYSAEFIKNLIAVLTSIVMLVPLLLIVVNSLKNRYDADTMSLAFTNLTHIENYKTVIEEGNLIRTFFNSLFYSAVSVGINVILTTMAAFVIARNKTKINHMIYFYVVLGLAMPANYITLTKVMQLSHIINSQLGIILLYTAGQIPFSIFLIYGFISTIPRELDEAGIIDGCKPMTLFFKIIFPLLKPVIVTLIVLNFMGVWNNFIDPLYFLNNSNLWPMTLAVYNFFGRFSQQWNLVCADIVLTSVPVVLIYILGQKYIVSGITTGSVKG
jgi:raffinose/stachyose/melibiose transport system permease protein